MTWLTWPACAWSRPSKRMPGKRLAEALIKQLTGGTDTIKARFLFEEYFEYRPQFKVFLATNHKPRVNPGDDAIWERIRLIPFLVQIPKQDRDKQLETKLRAELPGILVCLDGAGLSRLATRR